MKQCRFRSLPELSQGAKISHPAFALFAPLTSGLPIFCDFPIFTLHISWVLRTLFVFLLTLSII